MRKANLTKTSEVDVPDEMVAAMESVVAEGCRGHFILPSGNKVWVISDAEMRNLDTVMKWAISCQEKMEAK